jgi:RNA polymerase sigma-70 factor (ECF subfamily)
MEQPTDQELIAAANHGDADALETLYFRYRDWVLAVAFRVCLDREDALDVVQEVFIYFFGKFPGFKLRCQLKTFLYPVTRHRALDRIRKRVDTVSDVTSLRDLPAPPWRDAAAERQSLSEQVGHLPSEQREVVLLRFADGLSLAEIGQALDIPVGTVKSRLHNALATLRKSLSAE